jgi:3-carboxy-cis,cis-muconate cycloisomerase
MTPSKETTVDTSAPTDAGLLAPAWAGTPAAELVGDEAWLRTMLEVEVALARAQARLGLVPASAVSAIERAAASGLDLAGLAARARESANPVVGLVQALAAAVAAEEEAAAEFVHRGGTSQDILDSAAMLIAVRVLAVVDEDLRRLATSLAELAERHRADPMPGRTLTQHAVPITFGLKAAGWLNLVLDARDRLAHLAEIGLPAQLGGAAGTLSSYAEYGGAALPGGVTDLLPVFAAEVGLRDPVLPWHTARAPVADLAALLTFIAGALGKIALDVQGLARTEVAEVAEPAAAGRGASSAMPQKVNPVLSTLVVTAARQVPLYATVLAQSMLAEDERAAGAWHAEWQPLRECLRLVGGAAHTAAELAEGLVVHPDRMRANLGASGGAIVAERLTAVLAPVLGRAPAKALLARLSAEAAAGAGGFGDLLRAAPEVAEVLDPATVIELLDPERYLGASQALVDRALKRYVNSAR